MINLVSVGSSDTSSNSRVPVLSIDRLGIVTTNGRSVIRDVSLDILPGEIAALVGESGSGKTMIARAVPNLLPSGVRRASGSIFLNGRDISQATKGDMLRIRGRHVGYVFQEPLTALDPSMRIGKQLSEALVYHHQLTATEVQKGILAILDRLQVGNPERCLSAYPHQLSGGIRQRLLLASVMLLKPELLITDEPTTALDALVQIEAMELMVELCRESGMAMLLISHDLGLVARYADSVMVMKPGEITERGPTRTLISDPQSPYTRELINAFTMPLRRIPERAQGQVLLRAEDLSVRFALGMRLFNRGSGSDVVIGPVSLSLQRGESLALVGESGSGKTTIARVIAGLQRRHSGSVRFLAADGLTMNRRDLNLQFVFQDPFSSLDPRMTVGAILAEPLRQSKGMSRAGKIERVQQTLLDVGLPPDFSARLPNQLSGGQRQRVAIGRAIISRPELVIADEPVSALDATVQHQILTLINALRDRFKFGLLLISHDLNAVRQIADRVIVMRAGQVVEMGRTPDVFHGPKSEYVKALLAASTTLQPDFPDSPPRQSHFPDGTDNG
ncbi:peptide/nickel transport system ATP-binding protein [Rhizobium sp. PP-F2F-G38]|nr:peptide/nickel transport system ATP-binding protein [Rhizobium sp. PP-WC-1G-195]PYE92721.1 peptide/nickel transport system ATP-binding protein [Rhizobium sp. PP-F2F-G38]TCP77242.1 peptide/nickel transport system ATP-binding protein [Rhizobium sp. PP-CC-2G-626]TCQ03330.1 peptide/nickel transport system ATP-binding protein [Rhizobium sp. PP-F2F-G36]